MERTKTGAVPPPCYIRQFCVKTNIQPIIGRQTQSSVVGTKTRIVATFSGMKESNADIFRVLLLRISTGACDMRCFFLRSFRLSSATKHWTGQMQFLPTLYIYDNPLISSHLKWHYIIYSVNRALLRCTQTNEIDTLILDVSKMKQYRIPKNVHHFIFTQESNRMQCALFMHNARQASRHRDLNSPHCTVSHNNWVTFPRHVRKTIRTIILMKSLAFGERNWSHGCRKGSCV